MQLWKLAVMGIIAFSMGIAFARAETVPPLTNDIMDQADVLGHNYRQDLAKRLARLPNTRHVHMVVFFPTDLGGQDIATFSGDVARKWGVGTKGKDNGLLLVIAPKERKLRLEVGYGLEGDIPDAKAAQIIAKIAAKLPKGKEDWFGAINVAIDEVEKAFKPVY